MSEEENKTGKITFCMGADTFSLREQLRDWRKRAEEQCGEFNVLTVVFDLPERNPLAYLDEITKKVASELLTPSFFGEKRVIFLENFPPTEKGKRSLVAEKDDDTEGGEKGKKAVKSGAGDFLLRVVRALKNLPPQNAVIISSEEPDGRLAAYKELQKIAKTVVFHKKEGGELTRWILQRVAHYGGKMLPAAAPFLTEYIGNEPQKIDQEIRKLVNFCEEKPISEADIQKLCVPSAETEEWALSGALQEGNLRKAIKTFHAQMENGDAPQKVLLVDIAPTVRNLLKAVWAVANKKTARDAGLNPWLFDRLKAVAGRLDYAKIKEAYAALLLIDEGTKNGKIEISGTDYRLFSLVVETFFLEFFGEEKIKFKSPLLRKK